jgi:hypothetical protein
LEALPCAPAGEPRFVLDVHLGTLAAYLRMLGFDTLYRNDSADRELAEISAAQTRILLTRDLGLLKRSIVRYGYFLRATRPPQQLAEVVQRYGLRERVRPFVRCMRCNGKLEPVAKETVCYRLPERVALFFDEFMECADCRRIYWKGSHVARMLRLVETTLGNAAESASNGSVPLRGTD